MNVIVCITLLDKNVPIKNPDDREYDADYCIISQISKNNTLERLLLRNKKYDSHYGTIDELFDAKDNVCFFMEEHNNVGVIPQNELIKFI